jgi:outer membrane receptor for monomeric catechols
MIIANRNNYYCETKYYNNSNNSIKLTVKIDLGIKDNTIVLNTTRECNSSMTKVILITRNSCLTRV